MPDRELAFTLLKEWAKTASLNMPVVMMSGHASIDTAVEATENRRATDFSKSRLRCKSCSPPVDRALKYGEMQAASGLSLDKLGNSPAIQELNRALERSAKQNTPALLAGETGSPFELVARYFHKNGTAWVEPRQNRAYRRYSARFAAKSRRRHSLLAISPKTAKISSKASAFCSPKPSATMCAFICACSRTLAELAENPNQDGKLLATLAAFTVGIPPLRSQPDDIVFLVNQIVTELAETQKIPLVKFSTAALNIMRQYDWPGNLDQLRSIVKNLALTADNDEVGEQAVNNILGQFTPNTNTEIVGGFNFNMPLRELREELERRYFEYHIAQEGQNMSRVAQKVGLERTHLYRKLKQLGINFSRRQGSDKNGEE